MSDVATLLTLLVVHALKKIIKHHVFSRLS